ncbi:MAG: alpha-amylase [Anaerolineae bacterium]|nr:alpha-amylase [Anaerolineae bacterium]
MPTLNLVKQKLTQALAAGKGEGISYAVPGLWLDPGGAPARRSINPYRFLLSSIEWIEGRPQEPLIAGAEHGEWSRHAVIYNVLVHAATGFDHDGDGKVSLDPVGDGWMETGTFLKTIALLPTVKRLGFNTVHLLPITTIGQDGNKGTLGSPYAIRNPYRIDPRLAEPALGLDVETEFAAFVDAAHHLGLRVVVEFVFRTASKDADWAAEHPEWFYWIRADVPDRVSGSQQEKAYGPPIFTLEELVRIKELAPRREHHDLIPPHSTYRKMFTPPPERVEMVDGRWIGTCADGTHARIPGAFADWPPDDPQPPWGDVTYLRLYDHADFNYIAYNTVRMYDRRLAKPENVVEPLWERVVGILPHYQRAFGIDGVMIDMGHALPMTLKQRMVDETRRINPDFAFWDENFTIARQNRDEGYNAVIGNFWWMAYRPQKLVDEMLRTCAQTGYPLPFFAAPESHNTPRAAARPGGLAYARMTWALGCLLPALPFCHAGFEVGEKLPVNTGLDFLPEELPDYPSEKLALFSEAAYRWENTPNLVDWIRRTLAIRARHADLITDSDPATCDLLETDNPHVWAVIRRQNKRAIGIIFNLDWENTHTFSVQLPTTQPHLSNLLSNDEFAVEESWLRTEFPPSHCAIVEL